MRKLILGLLVFLLVVNGPLTSVAFAEEFTPVDTTEFEFEGDMYTLTIAEEGDTRKVLLKNQETNTLETSAYNQVTDQLYFNDELVDNDTLQTLKSVSTSIDIEESLYFTDSELSADVSTSEFSYSPDGIGPTHPWKLVKTSYNSLNIKLATVLFVLGLIALIPTGTGWVAYAVFSAKVLAALATAIVASLKSTGNKYVYFKLNTYYKAEQGYHKYKYTLYAYRDSARRYLIKSISHETRLGTKPPSGYGNIAYY